MTYADQAALAIDTAFRARVRMAVVTAAKDVMGETQPGSDAEYGKRQALAAHVLTDGGSADLERFAWAVTSNAAVTSSSLDSDIQFTVNSLWDDLAGVTGNE
jgi:hypothetical protein